MLQAYDYAGDEVTLVHADDVRLRRMAVFDVLINNADRKGGHILSGVDGERLRRRPRGEPARRGQAAHRAVGMGGQARRRRDAGETWPGCATRCSATSTEELRAAHHQSRDRRAVCQSRWSAGESGDARRRTGAGRSRGRRSEGPTQDSVARRPACSTLVVMTDHDRAAARREITDALQKALDRRHEVLDVIVEAGDRSSAVEAIATLLGTSHLGGEAVMAISFDQLTRDSRRRIAEELEDLNKQLTFTLGERPASSGESLVLRVFSGTPTATSSSPAPATSAPRATGRARLRAPRRRDQRGARAGCRRRRRCGSSPRRAADKVGMVFGELVGGEVNVRVWIHPDYRHRGFGTAALRRCRTEMAAYFPAVPMVVRAPVRRPVRRHR